MLSELAIDTLIARIGWAQVLQPFATGVTVGEEALTSTSGRTFDASHQLATAENLFAAIPNAQAANNETFNAFLNKFKRQAVLKVASRVFNSAKALYGKDAYGNAVDNTQTDYSDKAIAFAGLLDDAIGYQGAIDVIELLISSPRINSKMRAAEFAVGLLKIELYGGTDGAGTKIDNGLTGRLNASIKAASDVLFFNAEYDGQPIIQDISDMH